SCPGRPPRSCRGGSSVGSASWHGAPESTSFPPPSKSPKSRLQHASPRRRIPTHGRDPSAQVSRPYSMGRSRSGADGALRPQGGPMEQKQQQGSRYGSRWKKWLLVYVAIAAIAYLVIYLVFFHHGGGYG